MSELVLRPMGLFLDPAPTEVPSGALSVADDIVIRRKGQAEPRVGFEDAATGTVASYLSKYLVPYRDGNGDEAMYAVGWTDGFAEKVFRKVTDLTTAIEDTEANGPELSLLDEFDYEVMQGQLYICSQKGIYSLASTTSTQLRFGGFTQCKRVIPVAVAATDDTTEWFGDDRYVSYKAVLVRETALEQRIASAPSSAAWLKNEAGAARLVRWTVYLPYDVIAGDKLEIYRTVQADAYSGIATEYYLAQSVTISSTDISNGYVTGTDISADLQLGAALYTNIEQEGVESSNFPPPYCKSITSFAGMAFCGNIIERHQAVLELAEDMRFDSSQSATFNGTTSVTVADTSALRAGMYVTDSSSGPKNTTANITALTTIVSIDSATTFTMSAVALSSNSGVTIYCGDGIKLDPDNAVGGDDEYLFCWNALSATEGTFQGKDLASGWFQLMQMARLLDLLDIGITAQLYTIGEIGEETSSSNQYIYSQVYGRPESRTKTLVEIKNKTKGKIVFTRDRIPGTVGADFGNFEITLTRPELWSTAGDASDVVTSKQETRANRIRVSKLLEQEHFPLDNWIDLGDRGEEIRALKAVEDFLYAFTSAGVYRITGYSPTTLTFHKISEAVLANSRLVAKTPEGVIAVTTDGVLQFSSQGVSNLSNTPIGSDLSGDLASLLGNTAYLAYDPINRELHLGYSTAAFDAENPVNTTWVLNLDTLAWTKTSRRPHDMVFNPADGKMYEAYGSTSDGMLISKQRDEDGSDLSFLDEAYGTSMTISSIEADGAVLFSGPTLVAGDAFVQGATYYTVTSVTGSGVYVAEDTSSLSTGSATAYAGYAPSIAFLDQDMDDPTVRKLIYSGSFYFEDFLRVPEYTISLDSDYNTAREINVTGDPYGWPSYSDTSQRRHTLRFDNNRAHGWIQVLIPKITITRGRWRLAALKLLISDSQQIPVRSNAL